jgi:1-acyl-sn-glycerol-3-phosphate acyltransferase
MLPKAADLVKKLKFRDAGHGFDELGLHPPTLARSLPFFRFFYEKYFRVTSYDAHHIPTDGPAVIACNHSGTVPIDAMMVALDIVANTHPPRLARPAMDFFVPMLPFIGTFFTRCGAVNGSRGNFRRLLDAGEMVLVFPEGVPGVSKPIWERYQLQQWRVGHVELAIRHSAPVIPVAVVGAEEQWPTIAKITAITAMGVPHIPVPITPLPMPVHYHVLYGEPLNFHEEHPPDDADDPQVLSACAARVKASVEKLIARGRAERKGIFA